MTPAQAGDGMSPTDRLKDFLLSNSALTDGLTDEQAKPLIEWAMQQAEQVGPTIADEDDAEHKQTNLNRLVLYINRFTQYRLKEGNGPEWVQTQLDRLDQFSQHLNGPTASEVIRQKLLDNREMSHDEVLAVLMDAYDQRPEVRSQGLGDMETRPMPSLDNVPETGPDIDMRNISLWADDNDNDETSDPPGEDTPPTLKTD